MKTKSFTSSIADTFKKQHLMFAPGAASLLFITSMASVLHPIVSVAQSVKSCQCTDYVANRFNINGYPDAKDWNNGYLQGKGFTQVSVSVGSIVVMENTFPGANKTYGHVGIVESINSNGTIRVRGANQGNTNKFSESGCNNVVIIGFGTSVNGRSDVSFWTKGNVTPTPPTNGGAFQQPNVSSNLSINVQTIDLTITASNLSGKTVYVQMWRPATNGNPERTWNYDKKATGTSITFNDLDGLGNTFPGVDYYTVASLSPIASGEAAKRSTGCYLPTNRMRLCDTKRR